VVTVEQGYLRADLAWTNHQLTLIVLIAEHSINLDKGAPQGFDWWCCIACRDFDYWFNICHKWIWSNPATQRHFWQQLHLS
jgi:hypothetical protein